MLGVRCAAKRIPKALCPLLAEAAFLRASGQCSVQRQQIRFAGAGNSAGPFARPKQRFRDCNGVNVPVLRLRYHAGKLANPFDLQLLRSFRFRGRSGANSSPETRYPRRLPRFRCLGDLHSPTGHCSRSDQSGQSLPQRKARFATRPIVLHSPQRPQFDSRFGSTFRTRLVSLGESFREPWN